MSIVEMAPMATSLVAEGSVCVPDGLMNSNGIFADADCRDYRPVLLCRPGERCQSFFCHQSSRQSHNGIWLVELKNRAQWLDTRTKLR